MIMAVDEWGGNVMSGSLVIAPKYGPVAIKRGELLREYPGTIPGLMPLNFCPIHCDDFKRLHIRGRAIERSPAVNTTITMNTDYIISGFDCNCSKDKGPTIL